MNTQLPINYTKSDVQKFFLEIGAEQSWIKNVKNNRMMYLLSLIWDRRSSIKWSEIPEAFKEV